MSETLITSCVISHILPSGLQASFLGRREVRWTEGVLHLACRFSYGSKGTDDSNRELLRLPSCTTHKSKGVLGWTVNTSKEAITEMAPPVSRSTECGWLTGTPLCCQSSCIPSHVNFVPRVCYSPGCSWNLPGHYGNPVDPQGPEAQVQLVLGTGE